MTLLHRLVARYLGLVLNRPLMTLAFLGGLAVASGITAKALITVNHNQLDLIDPDFQEVKDVRRLIDMVGGSGHLLIGLRGSDRKQLKEATAALAKKLLADHPEFRSVVYQMPAWFIRDRAPLFMATEDLKEVRRQVSAKLKDVIRRASPFFFEIEETKPYEMNLDPIIDKYRRVGRKSITDDFYISDDGKMVLLVTRPKWDTNELEKTEGLIRKLRKDLADFKGPEGNLQFVEDYDGQPASESTRIEYGFAGSYKINADNAALINSALIPTSFVALGGIALVLLLFLGRKAGSILVVLSGLVVGVAMTFGFAAVAIGELNMITGMLAAILMGLGIDFGIHFLYRLREEFGHEQSIEEAIQKAVIGSGQASAISAIATGSAFFILTLSSFKGFSEFGLIAGVGILLVMLSIYAWCPALLMALERTGGGRARRVVGFIPLEEQKETGSERRIPRPKLLLTLATIVAIVLSSQAHRIGFNYSSRSLLPDRQESLMMRDEIDRRFSINAEPLAIFTPNLQEAKRIFDYFTPLDREKFDSFEQIISLFTFVPPKEQQEANSAILAEWGLELQELDRDHIPEEHLEHFDTLLKFTQLKPFDHGILPPVLIDQFKSLPEAKPENQGWLTYIYPSVDVFDGQQLLRFNEQAKVITLEDGTAYRSAGVGTLWAKLARIVIEDGLVLFMLTAGILLVILMVDLKRIRRTVVALLPLVIGLTSALGLMAIADWDLNFMNVVVFTILLGYGISHGVYLIHRFLEGASPYTAMRSVGAAVACSTLTSLAGWGALLTTNHAGLRSVGLLAVVGMSMALAVSFTIMPSLLQILHDRRVANRTDDEAEPAS